ncbi:hypothetical protein ANCDUO_10241, partial [Ancylostoma duodenale]
LLCPKITPSISGLTKIRVPGHLNYKEIRHRFERQSTFHGISHAALAPNNRWRCFWYTAFWLCFFCLAIQIFFLVVKYLQYAKTVDLDSAGKNANQSDGNMIDDTIRLWLNVYAISIS